MVKSIANKIAKLNKIPHPKGRKTAQLTKKTIQAAGRQKTKLQNQMRTNIIGEKLMWFKDNLEPAESYTPELLLQLIEKYLGRFNEELELIELKHSLGKRKGRQHASREDIIKMTIKNERNEFDTCGIEIPDILNQKQLNLLKNWSGELRFLQNFKLVRFNKSKLEGLKNESTNRVVGKSETEKKVDASESQEIAAKEKGTEISTKSEIADKIEENQSKSPLPLNEKNVDEMEVD